MDKKICKKCGMCAEICPANAIEFIDGEYPVFNKRECISCLCCLEICPHQAIITKARGFKGLFTSY